MADFEPGSKVICVNTAWYIPDGWPAVALPELHREYVVRTIADYGIGPGLRLHWLVNPPMLTPYGPVEPQFALYSNVDGTLNFRPVIERKTDISELERLLLSKNVRTPERV